ncbi:MAG: putative porin [Candidatus Zixiibacteriota bacterium]
MKRTVLITIFILIFTTASFAGDWWENVKIKGDLRYRHEMIDEEGKDANHRQRIRARLAVEGKVNEEMKAVIQLATGSSDPVSTNQTLDDAFTTKNIGLDMAYFEYNPNKLNGLKITGGKFHNPFFKPGSSELIWDSDWNPEGGTFNYHAEKDNIDFSIIGAGLWVDQDSKKEDVSLLGGQGIVKFYLNEKKTSVALGGSYYLYNNLKGHKALYEVDNAKGNSVDIVYDTTYYVTYGNDTALGGIDEYHTYQNDYDLIEAFLEVSHKFENTPVTVMFDYVTNTAADSLENGWLAGIHIGKAKNPGSWDLRYIYREVEKDAVVGAFTDSDFRGGGTDANGHEFGGNYMVTKNAAFGVTYFANTIGLDAEEENFGRLQIDLQLKF